MPRLARIDLAGHLYHLIVRGVERRSIFRDDKDRFDFLSRLSIGIDRTQSVCLTWALMTNHLHLLLIAGAKGLAALMHPLLTGYVGAFNRRHQRVGHLVQNRFKTILCQSDTYLMELLRYIPLNPVRAGLIKTPQELARYPWTGHAAILGHLSYPWQATEEVLNHFGSRTAETRQAYETHVIDAWSQGHRPDLEGGGLIRSLGGMTQALKARAAGDRQAFDNRILGDGHFVETILRQVDQMENRQRTATTAGLTLENLQSQAAAWEGVEITALLRRDRRPRVASARALWVYAATEMLRVRSAVFEKLLGKSSGAISEIRQRGQRLANKSGFLKKFHL